MTSVNETFQTTILFDGTDLFRLGDHLNKVVSEKGLLRQRLKEMVMRSVVRNIRKRFLRQAELALEMETMPKGRTSDGTPPWQGVKSRYRANQVKIALDAEFEALAEAQGSGADNTIEAYRTKLEKLQRVFVRSARRASAAQRNPRDHDLSEVDKDPVRQALKVDPNKERALRKLVREQIVETRARMDKLTGTGDIRARIQNLQERLKDEQGKDRRGQRINSHFLSKVRGEGMFRMQMAKLLTMITDMSLLDVRETRSGMGVGVGQLEQVESLRTPSATAALRGTPTRSRYTTFWRHLEFGTGVYSKKAGNPGGFVKHSAQGVPGAWYYGNDKHGILAKGSKPMNFITDKNNDMYEEDRVALEAEVDKFMGMLLGGSFVDTGSASKRYTASVAKKTVAAKPVVAEQWINEIFGSLGYRNERR